MATILFTYGTLMRGYGLHRLLAPGAKLLGAGSVRGTLLDLGDFPGLVDGAGRVVGEVYRLDAPELLALLDRAEGYNFDRRRATVRLATGRRARVDLPIPWATGSGRAHPGRGLPASAPAPDRTLIVANRRTQWR